MAYLVKPFTQDRPGAGDRDGGQPVRRARSCSRPRSPTSSERLETRKAVDRAKGVLQEQLGPQRARRVPLDPEDRDGPAALDARGRRGRRHATARDAPATTAGRLISRTPAACPTTRRHAGHEMATTRTNPAWPRGRSGTALGWQSLQQIQRRSRAGHASHPITEASMIRPNAPGARPQCWRQQRSSSPPAAAATTSDNEVDDSGARESPPRRQGRRHPDHRHPAPADR